MVIVAILENLVIVGIVEPQVIVGIVESQEQVELEFLVEFQILGLEVDWWKFHHRQHHQVIL